MHRRGRGCGALDSGSCSAHSRPRRPWGSAWPPATPRGYPTTAAVSIICAARRSPWRSSPRRRSAKKSYSAGCPLVALAWAIGRGGAIVAIAIPFALAHLLNPNLTALGVGNIALAGIFLGVVFYAPGGIWTATGAHLGWNGMLACLDTPVSGLPFDIPLLDYRSGGPAWLTGGAFGVEGGLAATIALTIAIPLAARWARSGRDAL